MSHRNQEKRGHAKGENCPSYENQRDVKKKKNNAIISGLGLWNFNLTGL